MVEAGKVAEEESRKSLLEKLHRAFAEQWDQDQAQRLSDFAQIFLSHFPLQDWEGRSFKDILGCCHTLWHHFQTARVNFPNVRLFNPSQEEHGWISGRTVLAVLQRDMPFMVDSIRLELTQRDIPIHVLKSTVFCVGRNQQGVPMVIAGGGETPAAVEGLSFAKEALVYMEIGRHTSGTDLTALRKAIQSVLTDVSVVVDDFDPMLHAVGRLIQNLSHADAQDEHRVQEVRDFLHWLNDSHFTFLGYREFEFTGPEDAPALCENAQARLGIFRKRSAKPSEIPPEEFSRGMREFHESDALVAFSKGPERSSIHRAVYPDYVVVKRYDADGKVCGEARLLGLFTYSVYTLSPTQIPIVRDHVAQIMKRSNLDPQSHDGKNLRRVIENFPRDEFFQATFEELYQTIIGVARINERHVVRLFVRKDRFGNFVNCLVYVPRDVYTTEIRLKIESLIGKEIGSGELDSTTYFSESALARAQIVFRVDSADELNLDIRKLESRIVEFTRSWRDQLEQAFIEAEGEGRGLRDFRLFKNAFSSGYQESFDARTAVHDVAMLEQLREGREIAMNFYRPLTADEDVMRFRVIYLEKPIELSQVVPLLEHLGLRVLSEHPYKIRPADGRTIWLHDFELKFGLPVEVDVHAVRALFEEAFAAVWHGETETDAFNRLVLGARLNWREVGLLRAYAAYMKQTTFNFSQDYIADTLTVHLDITRNLVALFKAYFNPRLAAKAESSPEEGNPRAERLETKILDALENVPNLNEDRILRHYLALIQSSLRTNYFQPTEEGTSKDYVAIKLDPRRLPDIPQPKPHFEIFVYSPRMEGVHLRGGKVARGGLRWSDRLQDYRTEVLGLMKAQQVKNAVIVPTGAKGGFVPKRLPVGADRDMLQQEAIACYRTFIRGLLDLTDNYVGGQIEPPVEVVRRDDDDPYMVVAADKGTASFSDIANEISLSYNHWLGDAFASGGSHGYDHKRTGITARGAWVSVQRHFRERGMDIQQDDFSVVGVGDMAGDVFGNGMLLSRHICLVGAFNHMHIFVDPTPDPAASFDERARLFEMPRSTWDDYDRSLISAGGGVFPRSAKSIDITPEMQKVLGIEATKLTPNELIQQLLLAPVDLLWNGGIGTYVKASSETHAQIGDKSNDSVRVDGRDLRCRVIGEGGNLGMSQLGRVEYALNGGACNTDFIDNAAGVDCSDHEVNIKILLDDMVVEGDLTQKQRNLLLTEMTEQVAGLVLQNNYRQTQAISLAESQALQRGGEYRRFINFLESEGRLDRKLEFLPDDEVLVERNAQGSPLTRPELSVLISYSKMMLKQDMVEAEVAQDSYLTDFVETAFPELLREKFGDRLRQHRLVNEIVATQVANDLINNLGITGSHRLVESTGAPVAEVAKAYVTARDIFQLEAFNQYIRSLDNQVPAEFQIELLANMIRRVRRGTRWFLRNRRSGLEPRREIAIFSDGIERVSEYLGKVVSGHAHETWVERCELLRVQKVPEQWIRKLAMPDNLFSGLGVVEAACIAEAEPEKVSLVFFALMEQLHVDWFATQVSNVKIDSYWQAIARESLIDDIEAQLRTLSIAIMGFSRDCGPARAVEIWCEQFDPLISRWKTMVNEVQGASGPDFAMFSVALRELIDLAQATQHWNRSAP